MDWEKIRRKILQKCQDRFSGALLIKRHSTEKPQKLVECGFCEQFATDVIENLKKRLEELYDSSEEEMRRIVEEVATYIM